MILIADSGATKTEWCFISEGKESEIISTAGLNPNFVSDDDIKKVLSSEVIKKIPVSEIKGIYFYGAGCSGDAIKKRLTTLLNAVIPSSEIHIHSDLLGAARALLVNSEGFVCIIGTGSNSGYYDGNKIVANIPPLGFILGDEGSGAALGKKVLADFLKGIMPEKLAGIFRKQYGAEKDEIVSQVYMGLFPSKFIGGFVKFLKDNLEHDYCKNLVKSSLEEFVQRNLMLYKAEKTARVVITGSVAWHFREILSEVMKDHNFFTSEIIRDPIKGLIKFHRMNRII
jgi:N-acetylglucosamine kinase-like BadF-type ATPase